MRGSVRFVVGLAVALGAWAAPAAQAQDAPAVEKLKVTALAGERQRFAGFGTSQINGSSGQPYAGLTPEMRAEMGRALWGDLKFRTLRLWFHVADYSPQPGEHRIERFVARYVAPGVIADALKYGATTLLLAPTGLPSYLRRPGVDKNGKPLRTLRDDAVTEYASLVAEAILQLRDEHGVTIHVTGISNEPNTGDIPTPALVVAVVKALRGELDKRGLQSVGIIAPETASCDHVAYDMADALRADPDAWKALRGVATHSYNMAADRKIDARIEGTGKEYWMTEAGDNGPEEPGDAVRAAGMAGRFLNDMNHLVTHWIWFIGYAGSDPRDNATRIMRFDLPPKAQVVRFLKYDYFRQLSDAFDVGACFRTCECDRKLPNTDMLWSYGQKPAVNVAVAKNPDGTWGIGVSNTTGITSKWDGTKYYPAARYEVTLRVSELAGTTTRFVLRRSSAPGTETPIEAQDGTLSVTLSPLELVTMRSR